VDEFSSAEVWRIETYSNKHRRVVHGNPASSGSPALKSHPVAKLMSRRFSGAAVRPVVPNFLLRPRNRTVMKLTTHSARAISERLVLALSAFLAACAPDSSNNPPSGNGTAPPVVESEQARWKTGQEWRVDAQPSREIGSETREYQFSGIQGAVRLSDGRIAAGDAGSSEIRWYDPQGRFILAAGRSGGGPREFRRIGKMVPGTGDSLVVFDAASRRISIIGPDGTFGRTVSPAAATLGAFFAGALENGSYVFGVPVPLMPREGISRDSVVYLLVSADGAKADTLVVAPGGQQYQRVNGNSVARMTYPLGALPAANASGSRISLGATDSYEIREFGADGSATRLLRRAVHVQPYTDAHFRAVADRYPQLASAFEDMPRPNRAPAFASLLADRENNLWVQDYPTPGAASVAWTVFDPLGAMLGQIALPTSFRPTDIGTDYLLGVWTTELGVESVRIYSLRKS
jgi:hypothetical protein